eukprot:157824-Chlamydomonas_euryale.AAC.1
MNIRPLCLWRPSACGAPSPVAPLRLWRPSACCATLPVAPLCLWRPFACGAPSPLLMPSPLSSSTFHGPLPLLL